MSRRRVKQLFLFSAKIEDALRAVGVADEDLRELAEGGQQWSLTALPAVGSSADPRIASEEANRKAKARDFGLVLMNSEGDVLRERRVSEEDAANVLRANEFEKAIRRRGNAKSDLFDTGTWDNWASAGTEVTWERLQYEFRIAAELIGTSVDPPVFPFVYLWRHHVELLLKLVILRGREALGEQPLLENTHSLPNLWSIARPILVKTWLRDPDKTKLCTVDDYILEFHEVDPGSDRLRYPSTTSGDEISPPPKMQQFNPMAFQDKMQGLSDFLTGARSWIDLRNFCTEHGMLDVLERSDGPRAPTSGTKEGV